MFLADRRRVFVVAGERTAGEVRAVTGLHPVSPEEFAARLGKTPLRKTLREMRRHRWGSRRHFIELARQIRQPELRLEREDVVVLDARHASHHALGAIAQKARQAGATVRFVADPAVYPDRNRAIARSPHTPER